MKGERTTASSRRAKGRSRRFRPGDRELSAWAKALAHPARLAILRFLAEQATCYCGRIVEELPLAQSTVSQHLRALKSAGLIEGTVEGTRVCYGVSPAEVERLRREMSALLEALAAAPACGDEGCGR